jgi:hypothetical protein
MLPIEVYTFKSLIKVSAKIEQGSWDSKARLSLYRQGVAQGASSSLLIRLVPWAREYRIRTENQRRVFLAKFRQILTWKIRVQLIQRIFFHEKDGPNSSEFKEKNFQIVRFLW